jgi:hypothetical protein
MPSLLKQLELEELSLVDRPANAQAMVSLFKRDTSGDDMSEETNKMSDDMKAKLKPYMDKGMSEEEAMKAYESDMMKKSEEEGAEEEASAEPSELDLLKADNERLRKALIENGFVIKAEVIEKKAPAEEMMEIEGEMVAKSAIPAPVLKALEAAAVEKADIALTKRAEELLPHFELNAAKALLKFDLDEEVLAILRAADKFFEGTMEEVGKSDVDGEFASAKDNIDALVKAYMEEHKLKKGQYATAYAAVAKTDEGKALIAKSYKE